MNTFFDSNGALLKGGQKYTIHIPAANMPPTREFWSVTIYNAKDQNFIANDAHRYSIGDRTPGIAKSPNGDLTIYIQPNAPGEPTERSNWLPSSTDGNFYLVLRTYGPNKPLIDQSWRPPLVTPAP